MLVIAEVGSNFQTLHDCLMSIEKASTAKADIVKFQLFTAKELYGPNAHEKIKIDAYALNPDWLIRMKSYAHELGIEFMCTAFSVEGYKLVDKFVSTHKVASSEINHTGILEFLATTKKPVYLSTAGSDVEEIDYALHILRDNRVTLFYCVGDYPAKAIDMDMIEHWGSVYDNLIGYSDHSIDILNIPVLARDAGAGVIEKHVSFVDIDTPDSGHSLNFEEFKLFVKVAKGQPTFKDEILAVSNKNVNELYKRKFVVIKNIMRGEKIELDKNVGLFRPVIARPDYIDINLPYGPRVSMTAKRDLLIGECLRAGDV